MSEEAWLGQSPVTVSSGRFEKLVGLGPDHRKPHCGASTSPGGREKHPPLSPTERYRVGGPTKKAGFQENHCGSLQGVRVMVVGGH